jgi:hypothetical protein
VGHRRKQNKRRDAARHAQIRFMDFIDTQVGAARRVSTDFSHSHASRRANQGSAKDSEGAANRVSVRGRAPTKKRARRANGYRERIASKGGATSRAQTQIRFIKATTEYPPGHPLGRHPEFACTPQRLSSCGEGNEWWRFRWAAERVVRRPVR